jgi:hypothetical protein
MRAAPAEQSDGLEQAGLAGRIRPDDEMGARTERRVEVVVAAKIRRAQRVERGQDVVRTGMTTWT